MIAQQPQEPQLVIIPKLPGKGGETSTPHGHVEYLPFLPKTVELWQYGPHPCDNYARERNCTPERSGGAPKG